MQNIEPIPFAHHLLAPPMDFPFGLRSGGSIFGAPRNGGAFYRCHEGIDLFPKGPPRLIIPYMPSIGVLSKQLGTTMVLGRTGRS